MVIPHGPFSTAVTPGSLDTPGRHRGPRHLLFFGKIRPYKGVDLLLEAFAALPEELDVRLTVAGECGDKAQRDELMALAERSHGRAMLSLERVPDEEVTRLLQQADAMVLPYRHITTSGSGVLALCHGRPLVIPDLPALAELPDDAVMRYDGTVHGLSDALARVALADASVLDKMSAAALDFSADVSWSEIAARTHAELAELDDSFPQERRRVLRDTTTSPTTGDAAPAREHIRIAVVVPVGPKDAEAALDTLESAFHYLDKSRVIVAVDDTGTHPEFAKRVRELSPDIVVLPAPRQAPVASAACGSRSHRDTSGCSPGMSRTSSCASTSMR